MEDNLTQAHLDQANSYLKKLAIARICKTIAEADYLAQRQDIFMFLEDLVKQNSALSTSTAQTPTSSETPKKSSHANFQSKHLKPNSATSNLKTPISTTPSASSKPSKSKNPKEIDNILDKQYLSAKVKDWFDQMVDFFKRFKS